MMKGRVNKWPSVGVWMCVCERVSVCVCVVGERERRGEYLS
jgi:hypothetical protein